MFKNPLKESSECYRHPKWVRVEPGTVIPAGQPYRAEWTEPHGASANERTSSFQQTAPPSPEWFVDSSWRPPLELPTEPTWGIAVTKWATFSSGHAAFADLFSGAYPDHLGGRDVSIPKENVTDFIPLTDEQVARIEAAS
jgi:hypothetical protein